MDLISGIFPTPAWDVTCGRHCDPQPASWQPMCWWPRCRCWCPWWSEQLAGLWALPKKKTKTPTSLHYHRIIPGCVTSHVCWCSHPEETMLTTMEDEVDELWTSKVTRTPMTRPARGLDKTTLSWKMSPAAFPVWMKWMTFFVLFCFFKPCPTAPIETCRTFTVYAYLLQAGRLS